MKLKIAKPKTLFVYKSTRKKINSRETDPTTTVITTVVTGGFFTK